MKKPKVKPKIAPVPKASEPRIERYVLADIAMTEVYQHIMDFTGDQKGWGDAVFGIFPPHRAPVIWEATMTDTYDMTIEELAWLAQVTDSKLSIRFVANDGSRPDQPIPTKEIRKRYNEYLDTPHWRETRFQALRRAGWKCQRCGEPAKQVHHRTYARVGRELAKDLEALCIRCHVASRPMALNSSERM